MSIKESYENIADAIREAEGSSDPILQVDFPERIRAIGRIPSDVYTKEEVDNIIKDVNIGKNLMCFPYSGVVTGGNPYTVNGCTFTVLDDGRIKLTTGASGATANTTYTISNRAYLTRPHVNVTVGKTYTLTGCPKGGATSGTFRVSASYTRNGSAVSYGNDLGNGLTFTVAEEFDANTALGIVITVYRGFTSVDGVYFYPMLVEGSNKYTYNPIYSSDPFIYSTEEHVVGRWIDGYAIYEKTFIDTVGESGEDNTIQLPEGTKDIIDIEAMFNNGNVYVQAPIHTQNASEYMYTYVIGGVYHFTHNVAAWAGRNMVVTIRYTKGS